MWRAGVKISQKTSVLWISCQLLEKVCKMLLMYCPSIACKINFKASVCFVVFGEAEFRKLPLHHSQLGQIWEKDPQPPPLQQLGASLLKSNAGAPTKSLKLLRVKFGKEPLSVQLTPLFFFYFYFLNFLLENEIWIFFCFWEVEIFLF